MPEIQHCWVSGSLLPIGEKAPPFDLAQNPGPYTTARVEHGRAHWLKEHCARLIGDSQALGLPAPTPEAIREGFEALARAQFGDGPGIVRMTAGETPAGEPLLIAEARPLEAGRAAWRAEIAPFPHPGPGPHPGAKLTRVPALERARALALDRALDELLLFDDRGRLVEGSRSSLVIIDGEGRARTPAPALGGVASIALGKIQARKPLALVSDSALRLQDLEGAREIVALNAVRGARPITRLAGRKVGTGQPGEGASALARYLDAAGG